MIRSPGIVRSNSSSAKDNIVVYVCAPDGKIELAPDGRLTQSQLDRIGYKGWKRCEATGAREIERLSLQLSKQLFEEKKKMKVQQHLRENAALQQLMVRCRLRKAQKFSPKDVEMNNKILERARRTETSFMDIICTQFDPSTRSSALHIEVKPQSTSPLAGVGQKTEGLA